MRVRNFLRTPKKIFSDTNWRADALPPRFTGIYPNTVPARPHWSWRSALANCQNFEYIFLCQVNELKDDWKAWLSIKTPNGWSLIERYEYHGSHPGVHVHADCERAGIEVSQTGLNGLLKIPSAKTNKAQIISLRPNLFWEKARTHFRISDAGTLL